MAIRYGRRPVRVPEKDPDAEITYGMDWAPYLQEQELLSSEWLIDPEGELEVIESSFDASTRKTSVLLGGGVHQKRYMVTNRITFQPSGGGGAIKTDDRSMIIPVVNL